MLYTNYEPAAPVEETGFIFTDPQDLESYQVIEQDLLNQQQAFAMYQGRIGTLYSRLIDSNRQLEYRQYQIDDAALLCCRRHHVLTHGLGLGKTNITVLALYALYYPTTGRRPGSIQIAVPNLLSANRWTEDLDRINDLLDEPLVYEVIKSDRQLRKSTAPIFIYSHDLPKNKCRAGSSPTANLGRWLRKHRKPSCFVIDEVHGCQANSTRTKQLSILAGTAKRRIALSGTLTELKHVQTVCSQIIYKRYFPYGDPGTFTKNFSLKQKLNTNYTGRLTHNAPERFLRQLDTRKAPEYYNLMRRFIYRVRIDDPKVKECITVPESIIQMHAVEPTLEQQAEHTEYINSYQSQLNLASHQGDARALRLIVPLIKIANHPPANKPSNKLIKLGELVKGSPGKVVVFCHYVASARLVTQYLRSLLSEYEVVRLYATDPEEVPTTLNQELQVQRRTEFQYDPLVKVGVFSINLASQSIDLTAASDVIYYCCGWSAIQMQQSLKRAVRPGNPNKVVNSHYVYTRGLIDTHQVALAVEKIKGSRLLMDFDLEDLTGNEDLSPAEAVRRMLAT